ncbi:Clathrin adaptor, alpha-adaptin, appendage, Ig-like subdomain protein, partial [Nannochloropsis gaditana]
TPCALPHHLSHLCGRRASPPSLLPSMVQWSCTLAASGQGLLFQYPSLLQVLLRHNYQGHQGTLLIVYKNVSPLPSSPTSAAPSLQFRTFQASPSSTVPGLLLQASPLQVSVLGPGEEASQTVRVVCLEPFDASGGGIEVLVEFGTEEEEDGTNAVPVRYSLPLPLPVSVLHFVWGLPLRKEDFLAQWEAITVPQVQDTFLPTREDGKGEGLEVGPLIRLLTKQFHLQTVPELCQRSRQAQTWTFAGSLETGSLSPHGKQLRVLVLVRLEQYEEGGERCARGRKGYRLTVRSEHPACAMGVFKAIKLQLGA